MTTASHMRSAVLLVTLPTGSLGRLLTQYPLLMAHDAATCYAGYSSGTLSGLGCYQWKTQAFKASTPFMGKAGSSPSGFTSLLNCGARALDLRLTKGGACAGHGIGQICMHHSMLEIRDQTFESELSTVVRWAAANPRELVLLKLVPDNEGAPAAIQAALDIHNITSVPLCVGHGVDPSKWTVERAKTLARMPNGGMVLAMWAPAQPNGQPAASSCVDDNFDPALAYDPRDAAGSFEGLWAYANETVRREGRTGKFQEVQLMWQSSQTLRRYEAAFPWRALDRQPFGYGNLKSTQDSAINRHALGRLGGLMGGPALNLVKVNDICLHGVEIARRLGTNVTHQHEAECVSMCGGANAQNTCEHHATSARGSRHDA